MLGLPWHICQVFRSLKSLFYITSKTACKRTIACCMHTTVPQSQDHKKSAWHYVAFRSSHDQLELSAMNTSWANKLSKNSNFVEKIWIQSKVPGWASPWTKQKTNEPWTELWFQAEVEVAIPPDRNHTCRIYYLITFWGIAHKSPSGYNGTINSNLHLYLRCKSVYSSVFMYIHTLVYI